MVRSKTHNGPVYIFRGLNHGTLSKAPLRIPNMQYKFSPSQKYFPFPHRHGWDKVIPNLHSLTEHSPTASSWFMVPGLSLFPLPIAPFSPTQTTLACLRASFPTWSHPVQTGLAQAPSCLAPGPLHVLFLQGRSSSFSNWSDKIWVSNVCFIWASRGSKLLSSFGEQHIRLSNWNERRCLLF